MNYSLLLLYIATISLLIATPGPVVALVISDASRFGFRHALRTVVGTGLAALLLIGSASLVISGLLSVGDQWLRLIGMLGCLFIGWIAFGTLRHELGAGAAAAQDAAEPPPVKRRYPILNGFLVGISNPKDIVFFIAFFPQFIGITPAPGMSLAILTAVWILLDLLILTGYITIMKGGFFQRHTRTVILLSAGFLLAIALVGFGYGAMELAGLVR